MNIIFDWKFLKNEKPKMESKIIFKNKGKLILGIYKGFINENFPHYGFVGSEISTKSFNKKSLLYYPIYKNSDDLFEFQWDYYCEKWM